MSQCIREHDGSKRRNGSVNVSVDAAGINAGVDAGGRRLFPPLLLVTVVFVVVALV